MNYQYKLTHFKGDMGHGVASDDFEHAALRPSILLAYKGDWKKILEGGMLWRKYENELYKVRKFALKFSGIGNLSRLTSGTAQLQQMKRNILRKVVLTTMTTLLSGQISPRDGG
jgi:hypothetical protein